jgi:tRNA nucleotidyltransferase/poly(A) polymerase
VRFGGSLEEDLSRRDFTINAIAWVPVDLAAGTGRIVDPHGGRLDLERRFLRTVGDPSHRFAEDALRLVRAARFAGRLDLAIEPQTEAAIRALAPHVATVSGERIRDELLRMLERDPRPSRALRLLERLGLMAVVLPEVAALRGIPQAKLLPGDALDHSLAAVDAAPPHTPADTRLAALLHDLGKATTQADGHFIGHEVAGADLAAVVLERLRLGRSRSGRIIGAIRHHMYNYDPGWTDAAVRRLIGRLGATDRDLLFALRRADNAASGTAESGEGVQADLERRIAHELGRQPDLLLDRRLAVDGHDLQQELGLPPGPLIGRLIDRLVDAAIEDPALNERDLLLSLARTLSAER